MLTESNARGREENKICNSREDQAKMTKNLVLMFPVASKGHHYPQMY